MSMWVASKTRSFTTVLIVAALWPFRSTYCQTPNVTGTLAWTEVVAGTNNPVASPNGVLDPGEGARVAITFEFTPVGTPVTYQFPSPGLAPVAGFLSAPLDLRATAAQGGTWAHFATLPGFNGGLGIPAPDGSLGLASLSQPYPPSGSFPLPTNPLPGAWRAVWTPLTYEARLVTFQLQRPFDGDPFLFVHTGEDPPGNPTFGYARATASYGNVQIPVVPVPGAAGALGLVFATRRRALPQWSVRGVVAHVKIPGAKANAVHVAGASNDHLCTNSTHNSHPRLGRSQRWNVHSGFNSERHS